MINIELRKSSRNITSPSLLTPKMQMKIAARIQTTTYEHTGINTRHPHPRLQTAITRTTLITRNKIERSLTPSDMSLASYH